MNNYSRLMSKPYWMLLLSEVLQVVWFEHDKN